MLEYSQKELEGIFAQNRLSPEKHEETYRGPIQKLILPSHVFPTEDQVGVVVGAQSGAGKGALIAYARKMFLPADAPTDALANVSIQNSDDLKTAAFLPHAPFVALNYPTHYTKITDQDTNDWSARALVDVIERGVNVIVEGTLRTDRHTKEMASWRDRGIFTVLQCLAVPDLESLLSIQERYVAQVQERGYGRLVTKPHHDEAYKSMLTTVGGVEYSGGYDVIQILKRGTTIDNPIVMYCHVNGNFKTAERLGIEPISNGYHSAVHALTTVREEERSIVMPTVQERVGILLEDTARREKGAKTPQQLDGIRREREQILEILRLYEQYQQGQYQKKNEIPVRVLSE